MNKHAQTKYLNEQLRDLSGTFRRYNMPDDFMPETEAVAVAQEEIQKLEKIVSRFDERRRSAWEKIVSKAAPDLREVKRAILFKEPVDALKQVDQFRRKHARYLDV